MLTFTPLDHYWMVGGAGPHLDDNGDYTGDTTRVWSSKRNHYFANSDPEFVAWRDAKRAELGLESDDPRYVVTLIDTEANLRTVVQAYGISNPNFSPPPSPGAGADPEAARD